MPTLINHVHITDLWLPILASAVAVWIASALAWMAIGHHKNDQKRLPPAAEDAMTALIKSTPITPGVYAFPHQTDCSKMSAEEKKRIMSGEMPMGMLRVWGKMSMASPMIMTFIVNLVIGVVIAFLCLGVMGKGTEFKVVLHTAGLAAILAHTGASVCNDIWFQESRRAMATKLIDGVVYGVIVGLVFAWLWPR